MRLCEVFLILVTQKVLAYEFWLSSGAPSQDWTCVASDGSGQYLAGVISEGGIYTSDDYGTTWSPTTAPTAYWTSVASDSTGQFLVAAGGNIYTSENYGSSWSLTSAPSNNWASIASDSTGKYLAAAGGLIYTSEDTGSTWTQSSAPDEQYCSIASDSTGQYLAAAVYDGGIYTSNDYGSTWSQQTSAPTTLWWSIASDSTGQYLAAVAGSIYTSDNYGSTWSLSYVKDIEWRAIASDSSGQYLYAAAYADGIYFSDNYGSSWSQTEAPDEYWCSIATASADSFVIAAVSNGGIYYSEASPTSKPSSSPTMPSSSPSSQPTGVPSNQPYAVPSTFPSSQPSQNPTTSSEQTVYTFTSVLGADDVPQVQATVSNLGGISVTYYLTVSFLQTGFGNIDGDPYEVNIFVGDDESPLCYGCSVNNECGDNYVTCNACVNRNVTEYLTTASGGSLALQATASAPWTSQLCGETPSFTVQYLLSTGEPNPTWLPTEAPNPQQTLSSFVPWTVVLGCGILAGLGGVFLWWIRKEPVQKKSILSTMYDSVSGATSIVSQIFFAYVCFSNRAYFPFGIAWLVVRIATMTVSSLCLFKILCSEELRKYLDKDFVAKWRKVCGIVCLYSLVQPSALGLLPWTASDETRITGFPSFHFYYLISITNVVESFLLVIIHVMFAVTVENLFSLSQFTQISFFLSSSFSFLVGFISFVEVWLVLKVSSIEPASASSSKSGVHKNPIIINNEYETNSNY